MSEEDVAGSMEPWIVKRMPCFVSPAPRLVTGIGAGPEDGPRQTTRTRTRTRTRTCLLYGSVREKRTPSAPLLGLKDMRIVNCEGKGRPTASCRRKSSQDWARRRSKSRCRSRGRKRRGRPARVWGGMMRPWGTRLLDGLPLAGRSVCRGRKEVGWRKDEKVGGWSKGVSGGAPVRLVVARVGQRESWDSSWRTESFTRKGGEWWNKYEGKQKTEQWDDQCCI